MTFYERFFDVSLLGNPAGKDKQKKDNFNIHNSGNSFASGLSVHWNASKKLWRLLWGFHKIFVALLRSIKISWVQPFSIIGAGVERATDSFA